MRVFLHYLSYVFHHSNVTITGRILTYKFNRFCFCVSFLYVNFIINCYFFLPLILIANHSYFVVFFQRRRRNENNQTLQQYLLILVFFSFRFGLVKINGLALNILFIISHIMAEGELKINFTF